MARGGARVGGGRPKGSKSPRTIEVEKAREYVTKRVAEELKPIMDAQIEAAKGMYIEKKGLKIYQKEPDQGAAKYLLDQTIGRAKETVAVEGLDFIFDK